MFAPELKLNGEVTKLLTYFIINEDKCSLNKIWQIISENLPNRYFVCEKDCEKMFHSIYQKFQKEFEEDKNIWQPIKEILSKNISPNYIDQLAI